MAALAADAARMTEGLMRKVARIAEARAGSRREEVAAAMRASGIEARVEGEAVRLTGWGLLRRWLSDLALREAGRAGR